ncbi:hypothetical protein ACOME3_010500 [Neoechinorhynchus agilis]
MKKFKSRKRIVVLRNKSEGKMLATETTEQQKTRAEFMGKFEGKTNIRSNEDKNEAKTDISDFTSEGSTGFETDYSNINNNFIYKSTIYVQLEFSLPMVLKITWSVQHRVGYPTFNVVEIQQGNLERPF